MPINWKHEIQVGIAAFTLVGAAGAITWWLTGDQPTVASVIPAFICGGIYCVVVRVIRKG